MSPRPRKWPIVALRYLTVFCAVVIFAMLVDTFIVHTKDDSQLGASLVGVFGALTLAFLALASPGALEEFSFGPLKAKWRIRELESRVQALQLSFLSLLTCHERSHLRKLEDGAQDKDVAPSHDMYGELRRLQYLGYVKPCPGKGVEYMENHCPPDKGGMFTLREYLTLTDMGKKYLKIYREWTPSIKVWGDGKVVIDGVSHGRAGTWDDIVQKAMEAGWMSEPDSEDVNLASGASQKLRKP